MEDLISYAGYFAAYFIKNIKDRSDIKNIILFGSVARNEGIHESDVDIFIEVKKMTKRLEEEIGKITDSFYKSREAALFKLKNINNKINLKIGNLDNWKDLHSGISDGIILYGKYALKSSRDDKNLNLIIFWDNIEKNRGAFLNKVYGFKVKGKVYPGLLEKLSAKKLGKSCIMIDIKNKEEIFKLIKSHGVRAKSIEVFI